MNFHFSGFKTSLSPTRVFYQLKVFRVAIGLFWGLKTILRRCL
jgi:hypothetical protein